MPPLPRPRPRSARPKTASPCPAETIAVGVAALGGERFQYVAVGEDRSWFGVLDAGNPEVAALDAISEVRACRGRHARTRFAVKLRYRSPLFEHAGHGGAAESGLWIQCATPMDRALTNSVEAGLAERLAAFRESAPPGSARPESTPPECAPDTLPDGPALTVATDGSVRGPFCGFGWLAETGQYGLAGYRWSAKKMSAGKGVCRAVGVVRGQGGQFKV